MSAPTPVYQTISDERTRVIRKITIPSGGDAEISANLALDISTFTTSLTATSCKIMRLWWSLDGFAASLLWDASSDVTAVVLTGSGYHDYTDLGGLTNNAGSGITGDILLSTLGVGTADSGYIVLDCAKVA